MGGRGYGIKGIRLGDWKDGNATNHKRPQVDKNVGKVKSVY